jgi:hypothetical protein
LRSGGKAGASITSTGPAGQCDGTGRGGDETGGDPVTSLNVAVNRLGRKLVRPTAYVALLCYAEVLIIAGPLRTSEELILSLCRALG